jgi:hypothetical protein
MQMAADNLSQKHRAPIDRHEFGGPQHDAAVMGKWNDALKESRFKRVQDGFIFKAPGFAPPFAPRYYYLVSEAQKAEIQKLMRRSGIVFFLFLIFLIGQGLWQWSLGHRGNGLFAIGLGTWAILVSILTPPVVSENQLEPILADARYTEQRITWRERNEILARMLPISVPLLSGVASLACALLSALVSIGAVVALQRQYLWIFWIVLSCLFLGMAARFFYLVILRFILARRA